MNLLNDEWVNILFSYFVEYFKILKIHANWACNDANGSTICLVHIAEIADDN